MSCRCTGQRASHFTPRRGRKGLGGPGGGRRRPPSLSPLLAGLLFPPSWIKTLSGTSKGPNWHAEEALWGNTAKLETPGRADLHLMGACNYAARPLRGA